MSADNGVYIAKFPTCWRVCYGSAIENVDYYPVGSEERLEQLESYFGKSPLYSTVEEARTAAFILAEKYEYLEYGICSIPGTYEEFNEHQIEVEKVFKMKAVDFDPDDTSEKLEVVEEPNYEWFSLRNVKPTEMQLWMGDKRIANIQGSKHIHDIEEFIRMANLGIQAHREEIKRRVEAMVEYDPKDVAFNRGEPVVIQPIDEFSSLAEICMPPIFQRTESVQETEQT